MATITKGKIFVNGELVTPEKLHQMVDAATLSPLVNADIASNAAIATMSCRQRPQRKRPTVAARMPRMAIWGVVIGAGASEVPGASLA
jgi:hypothetical protein